MCTPLGISGTLAVWFFGGLGASQLACYTDKMYANGDYARGGVFTSFLKKDVIDPNPQRTLNTYHLGASGGLMSMLAVVSLWRGTSLWSFPLVNIPVQARMFGVLTVAWDYWGNYNNSPDGIGHNAHLCGFGMGLLITVICLRRGKYAKAWRIYVK